MGYLDYTGLQYLWGKLKEKFAPKSHSHDDRYYTESEMDGKLNSKVNNNEAGANGLLSKLTTSWTAAPTDDTYFIRQDIGGGNQFGRVKFSTIWNYIKGKTDGIYQPKGSYAASGHTHDDRYYTESEMNTKLSKKAENIVLANDANLNSITTPGFYSCGGGNKITNKPNNTDAIGLIVTHNASGSYYTQILTTSSNANTYRRTCLNGTWSGWTQDKYTDTNTWRGIQNNLTSDSTSDSLSAAQGKALKSLVDGKALKEHAHTKAQITDFPASLKNPTALTIQTNGATAATYDGSAAKTVNITKGNIGLGNVDNTADKNKSVASAAKLTTARTVSGGSDITLSFSYDGSGNSTANIGFYSCRHFIDNTNNYPFHRFAKLDANKNAWVDSSITFLISQDYFDGGYGVCRLVYRSNADSGNAGVDAQWLVRKGLSADTVQVAIKTDKTNGTYCDAFYKSSGGYMGAVIRAIASGGRASSDRTWTLIESAEAPGTTATDKKTSSECWKTIAEAGIAIHKQEYSSSASAIDKGYVASADSANTSSSCTGNSASATKLTSSAGSATQPIYFKDGKPVAGTYMLGDASSKIVRTLGAVGNTGWANKTTDDKYVPTMSFMTYWNGAYSSNGVSNLAYCDRGRFGTIVTKNTGDYLPVSGGTMSGQITKGTGGSLIGDRDRAAIKSDYPGDWSYGAVAAIATKNGFWTMGNYGGDESLIFNYSTDANYNACKNETSQVYLPAQAGTIITSTTIGSQSVDYANSAGNATNATTWNGLTMRNSHNTTDTWIPVYSNGCMDYVLKDEIAGLNGVAASGSNYVRFTNGTQICWGITNCKGKNVTASFAVAFNNTNYAVTIMGDYDSWADTYWITGNHTTTSFAIKASGGAVANRPINWIAVGTWK